MSILLLVSACSSIQPIHHESNRPDKVELGVKDLAEAAKKEDNNTNIKVEETVRVGDQGGQVYTNPEIAPTTSDKVERKIRIGLNLGPGLYRVINYVSVLKVLERQNLAPTVVTGTGMGAIVAAMYAVGMTPEMIEWNFYKYFKENKNARPYEKDWLRHIDHALLAKFKNTKVEDTKKKFFITLYNSKFKKAYYFDHGNIHDLLMAGLKLQENYGDSAENKYVAVFEKEVFNAHLLNQMGADFTLGIDSLGSKFDFDRPNEFLIGIYGRASGRIQKEKGSFDYIVSLPLSKINLDSTKDMPLSMKRTYEFMTKELVQIKNKMQTKMEAQ